MTDGLEKLREILATFPQDSAHWNEAENRFQFIDRLLVECLGWKKPNVRVEVRDTDGGISDYHLGQPVKGILEAKKEAKDFGSLPTGRPGTVRKLKPLLEASSNLRDAVHQALQYCALHGAPLAIVCNGPQLVIFQALTPGYSPLEGECFFFNGFDQYVENFSVLWSLLSPEGVTENRASRAIAIHRNPRMPPKASEFISEPTRFRYRNNFQENLRELSALLLEEVEDNPGIKSSFYAECYVPIEANNRHLLLSKKIIAARYKRVGGDGVVPSALDGAAQADSGQLVLDPAVSDSVRGSRPIVVIGDVGVGKTSFFENLYEKLDRSEKANTYFIQLNLGVKATLTSDIKSYVIEEISNALRDKYGIDITSAEFVNAIYHNELKAFDRGIYGPLKEIDPASYQRERIAHLAALIARRDAHLHASLGHLGLGRGKQIILIIDNADQRNFEVQQEAFLIAQELAATRSLLVFVALRPSTFFLSKSTGALSGYQHKILTISPPPADEVVQRRLSFAVRVAEGQVAPAALANIRLRLGSVVSFFNATLRSIRSNESIRFFLSNITGGNTRAVIELVTGFFGSPNVDSQKIVEIEESTGNYRVPLHEFTKHALLGEFAYFNAQSSLVACNLFDVSSPDPREHFLCGLVISFLGSGTANRDNDGYMSGERIVEEMARHGFVDTQVRFALRRLAAKRLVETPHAHYREIPVDEFILAESFHYRVTSSGVYQVRFWTGSFAFLDATSTDTPVFDEVSRQKISELAPSFDIGHRLAKAETFSQYLEAQWHAANITAEYYDFTALLAQQRDTFASVRTAANRGTSRPRRR